jgi:hypothetical protein
MNKDVITIVSGLPRSGTSMMMGMLEAGGLPVLTDRVRTADEDNPKGYYEFELVKKIETEQGWLQAARGKAVKMISALLKYLPPTYSYQIIFMRRSLAEVLASQRQMLIRRGENPDAVDDARMAALFEKHLATVEQWLAAQPHMRVLYVRYDEVVADALAQARRVNEFLGGGLDVDRMAAAVDRTLYRQRQR